MALSFFVLVKGGVTLLASAVVAEHRADPHFQLRDFSLSPPGRFVCPPP